MITAVSFKPVSPRYWTWRQVQVALTAVPVLLACLSFLLVSTPLAVLVELVMLVLFAWVWLVERGRYRAWGYAEREDDLMVRRGLLFRQLVVVPYGRMQFIDVTSGPLERAFGLATLQLHTAAAATDARIPGLAQAEAERLRDRLATLGEARATGL